ncbi:hypothetical protein M2158_006248 [Streptomyces sp. SAI-144]|nr:hypothetical protein [Streptomyces sp. SAI-144]
MRPGPAPRPAAAIRLCPQAWPRPGRASYSSIRATAGRGLVPDRAVNAVGSPATSRCTLNPAHSSSPHSSAAARCSSKAYSGSECSIRAMSHSRSARAATSPRTRASTSSTASVTSASWERRTPASWSGFHRAARLTPTVTGSGLRVLRSDQRRCRGGLHEGGPDRRSMGCPGAVPAPRGLAVQGGLVSHGGRGARCGAEVGGGGVAPALGRGRHGHRRRRRPYGGRAGTGGGPRQPGQARAQGPVRVAGERLVGPADQAARTARRASRGDGLGHRDGAGGRPHPCAARRARARLDRLLHQRATVPGGVLHARGAGPGGYRHEPISTATRGFPNPRPARDRRGCCSCTICGPCTWPPRRTPCTGRCSRRPPRRPGTNGCWSWRRRVIRRRCGRCAGPTR